MIIISLSMFSADKLPHGYAICHNEYEADTIQNCLNVLK